MPLPALRRTLVAAALPLALAALGAGLAACAASAPPPAAEFLVAMGDSTLWVRTGAGVGADGVELRRAPLLLARVDGRFYELYVTEEDYSFHDAVFLSQTVWRRDLLSGDSTVVFGDATVPRLATAYARAHPGELPLEPEEPGAEEATVRATLELTPGDVLGPYLTLEAFTDLHPEEGGESHRSRRLVVDVRTGGVVTLAALVGDSTGARVIARGRDAFHQVRDSLLGARGGVSHRVAVALGRFAFDEGSFAITRVRREPGVVFWVPGTGDEADGYALPLAPIPVPPGDWWREASATLPHAGDEEAAPEEAAFAEWRAPDGRYRLRARADRDGEGATLVLHGDGRRSWTLGRVGAPALRVHWLDAPAIGAAERRALSRAFSDAALYGGDVRTITLR